MPRSATILGFGLIGGSIGYALKGAGWRVAFVDPNVSVDEARSAADAKIESIAGISGDDLIVIATPVDRAIAFVESIREAPNAVTSVCSVMAPLCEAAEGSQLRFVAGHPFAGSELSGFPAARHDLFRGKRWFIESLHEREVIDMITDCEAEPFEIDAEEHDQAMALTSHLPQMISTALAAAIERMSLDPAFLGSGLGSILRLAGSSGEVWLPVIESNRAALKMAEEEFVKILTRLIDEPDEETFRSAQKMWEKLKQQRFT